MKWVLAVREKLKLLFVAEDLSQSCVTSMAFELGTNHMQGVIELQCDVLSLVGELLSTNA